MRDLVIVMPTADRSPRQNYLSETLGNLARSGVWRSERLHSFHVVDTGNAEGWPDRELPCDVPLAVHRAQRRRGPAENVAAALVIGAAVEHGGWVVFLEDDADVVQDFAGSIGRWLDDHGTYQGPMVYKFTGDHRCMFSKEAVQTGACRIDSAQTWSTVCMAMRPAVADDLAAWLVRNPIFTHSDGRKDTAYDLEMHHWAKARGVPHFIMASPSFCQHLGDASAIRPGDRRVIRFPSWPGRNWAYKQQQQEAFS